MSVTWVVSKESLEIAMQLLENIPTRNKVKSSEFIKVTRLGKDGVEMHLASTIAGKVTIRTGELFPFKKDLFLDRRLFSPFVAGGKEGKSSEYSFIGSNNQLIVKHGNRRATYTHSLPIAGYEEPQNLADANTMSINKKWTMLIDCAENFATDDPITPTLNCVYVVQSGKYIEAMSSNQRLVFYGKADADKKPLKGSIAFPLGLVKALRQEGATKLLWTNKLALVEFTKGKIWQAVKTAARKSFPYKDIKQIVEKITKEPIVCSISSGVLSKAANRLAGYTVALDSADLALEVHLQKGSKKIFLKAGVADSKFTELVYSLSQAKNDLVLEWPLAQVMPLLLFAKDEGNVRVHVDKSGASCISTKNLNLVVAPRSK